jgi:hypothetical protein
MDGINGMDGADHALAGGVSIANAPLVDLAPRDEPYVIKVAKRFIKVQVTGDSGGEIPGPEDLVPGPDSADAVLEGDERDG